NIPAWSRFKTSITSVNSHAHQLNGNIGGHFTCIIDSMNELAIGFNEDWMNIWPENEKMRFYQHEHTRKLLKMLQTSMKNLAEIFTHRKEEFDPKNALMTRRLLMAGDREETGDQPGCSAAEDVETSSQLPTASAMLINVGEVNLTVNDLIKVKEERVDVKEEPYDEYEGTNANTSKDEMSAEVKEEVDEDMEPLVDTFCPTTGTSRSIEMNEVEQIDNMEPLKDTISPTSGTSQLQRATGKMRIVRIAPRRVSGSNRHDPEVFNNDMNNSVPFNTKPQKCYLCDNLVYQYKTSPLHPARRLAFLDSIVLDGRQDNTRMRALKLGDALAFFCKRHFGDGNSKVPSPVMKMPELQEASASSGEVAKRVVLVSKRKLVERDPVSGQCKKVGGVTASYARKCDLCGNPSYPFTLAPPEKEAAERFYRNLINISPQQQRNIDLMLQFNHRGTVCSRHHPQGRLPKYKIRAPSLGKPANSADATVESIDSSNGTAAKNGPSKVDKARSETPKGQGQFWWPQK
ncbi:hypothetical protein PENTCL1PPCAC_29957, partial [Pristionchus entomophagus]